MIADVRPRCWRPSGVAAADRTPADGLMLAYHDEEWGVPISGDGEPFERLALESFQAGLAWVTILRKREDFRRAFDGFDPVLVSRYDSADRARLLADAAIVRNRTKIDAAIVNAAAFLVVSKSYGGFASYLYRG